MNKRKALTQDYFILNVPIHMSMLVILPLKEMFCWYSLCILLFIIVRTLKQVIF